VEADRERERKFQVELEEMQAKYLEAKRRELLMAQRKDG
jgi:hypothetical protein